MKCSIANCPGEYEPRQIVHTARYQGPVIVMDHVPAEVCSARGDVLPAPNTGRHIEQLPQTAASPTRAAPLYDYA
jgi:hypothetical protein